MSDPNPSEPSENSAVDPFERTPAESSGQGDPIRGIPKIVRFESLARCGDEIWIENEGQIYRLRKTRQGKLILTK
jgi:hemin uptake protein HemP